jgi:cyclohexa-1,5-dienecarbonyl-CoA hydratase
MTDYRQIEFAVDGPAARITLNRPPLNILNLQMMEELSDALYSVEKEAKCRVILIRGAGRCFSAGADIQEHRPDKAQDLIRSLRRVVETFIGTRTPVICVLHGMALGGAFEIAALADIVLVQEGCRLAFPEITLASFPPVAAAYFPSMIGWKHTLQLLLTGGNVSPERACDLGLATAVLPKEGFEERVEEWIGRFTRLSLPAVRLCKLATMAGFIQRPLEALTTAEVIFVQELMKTRDAAEGIRAFVEKREPVWEHR